MEPCLFCGKLSYKTDSDYICNSCMHSIQVGYVEDLSPKAFRRAYVKALFAENEKWLNAIAKYQMVVPGSPLNRRDRVRDQGAKEHLQDQLSADTYEDRKAFYTAWKNAPCCADDCDKYCDQCPNDGIKFKPVSAHGLDPDVRRFVTKYGRYQTASELEREDNDREEKSKPGSTPILSGVRDGKSDNGSVRIREQERGGLFSEPEEVSSDQAERVQTLLSYPISEEMVT